MEAKKKLSLTQETLKNLTQNNARGNAEKFLALTHTCACTCGHWKRVVTSQSISRL